jgi:hypothetical protein
MIAAMIMGAAFAAVLYNLKMSHPTCRNQPVIDYNIALLFQPMLLLGISIGVTFNIMFADWMVTLLLILLFTSKYSLVTSTPPKKPKILKTLPDHLQVNYDV